MSASGSTFYIINFVQNPTLSLERGKTYTFNVNASGHPFWIKTSPTTGTGDQYNDGVSNNGTETGVISFAVSTTASTSTLYYICQNHGTMQGIINLVGNGNTGTRAGLVVDASTRYLNWIDDDYGGGGPRFGTIEAGSIILNNTASVIFSDLTEQVTAFTGTSAYATQADVARIANSATTATNLIGGIVVGNVPQNNTNTLQVGYLAIPQVLTNTNYTIQLSDQGKHIYSTTATGIQTITIPTAINEPFPVGTAITLVLRGAGNLAINTSSGVTLYLAGTDEVGNRTLSTNGMATLLKVENNIWFINGTGLS